MRGTYNPITHAYAPGYAGDREYAQVKTKEFERSYGMGSKSRVEPKQLFNPINGESRPVPARPASAPRGRPTPSSLSNGGGASPSPSPAAALFDTTPTKSLNAASPLNTPLTPGSNPSPSRPRPSTPTSSRTKVMQGDSWGTYNPITHAWVVPPRDARFSEQNKVLEQRSGISGSHHSKTPMSPNQGVYNPVLNTWLVPPANARHIEGLSFKPAAMFSKPTAATIRV